MLGESAGRTSEATQLYAKELELDPQNALILKRSVGRGGTSNPIHNEIHVEGTCCAVHRPCLLHRIPGRPWVKHGHHQRPRCPIPAYCFSKF